MKKSISHLLMIFFFFSSLFIISCTKDYPNVEFRYINKTIEIDSFKDGHMDSLDIDLDGDVDFYFLQGGDDNSNNNFSKIIPAPQTYLHEKNIAYNHLSFVHLQKYLLNELVNFKETHYSAAAFLHHNVNTADTSVSIGLGNGTNEKYIAFKINGNNLGFGGQEGWLLLDVTPDNKKITIIQCGYLKNPADDEILVGAR